MNITEASRTLDLLAVLKAFVPWLPTEKHRDALFLADRARKALGTGFNEVHFWRGLVDRADAEAAAEKERGVCE